MAMTKQASLSRAQAIGLVESFIEEFQHWIKGSHPPEQEDLIQFVTSTFQLIENGRTQAKNVNEYLASVHDIRKKYSAYKTHLLSEPIVSDNQIVIYFEVELTLKKGGKESVQVMARCELEGNRINRWIQVSHEHKHQGK